MTHTRERVPERVPESSRERVPEREFQRVPEREFQRVPERAEDVSGTGGHITKQPPGTKMKARGEAEWRSRGTERVVAMSRLERVGAA
jgi:hypothetical protein